MIERRICAPVMNVLIKSILLTILLPSLFVGITAASAPAHVLVPDESGGGGGESERTPNRQMTFVSGLEFAPDDKTLVVSYTNRPPSVIESGNGRILSVLGYSQDEDLKRRWLDKKLAQESSESSGPGLSRSRGSYGSRSTFASNSLLRRVSDITAVAFSPDGKRVVGAGPGVMKIFDTQSGRPELTVPVMENAAMTHVQDPQYFLRMISSLGGASVLGGAWSGGALSVDYSMDGRLIAVCQPFGCSVRDAGNGREVYSFHHSDHMGGRYQARFSPDGKYLAVLCQVTAMEQGRCQVDVLNAADGKVLATYSKRWPYGDLRWASDSSRFGFFTVEGRLLILGLNKSGGAAAGSPFTLEELAYLPRGDAFAFSADGKRVVLTSKDEVAVIVEVANGQVVKRYLSEFPAAVKGIKLRPVAWSKDGALIAVGGEEYSVLFWNVK
ncbi:MAG TPA: hypothetical protein PKA48_08580 [Candidatus Obscuribacter sp.]|nr:hypothetical protein [Candidatus Obscuribacter sp.]